MKPSVELSLGPDVIQQILPHRRPLLLVDRVEGYDRGPRPTLYAARQISANRAIFDGHFPRVPPRPGIYTIEGLGQTGDLLLVIVTFEQRWREHGLDPEEVVKALQNLELGYRLHPGFRAEVSATLCKVLGEGARGAASKSV